MKKIIVVFGVPLSGKKTHAKLLSEKLGYKYFSFNDVVSEEIKNKTKIGLIMEKYSKSQAEAPDEYAIMLMKESVINLKEDGVVFNGFPQSVAQAKALDSFLFSRKTNKPIPVFLNTEPSVMLKRVTEEKSHSFKSIMDSYNKKEKLVADYYTSNRLEFDTSKNDIKSINEEIVKKCLLA